MVCSTRNVNIASLKDALHRAVADYDMTVVHNKYMSDD